ncbi:hypothetical protein ASF40_09580 [Microbacterium sp. Leaf288]|uniref:DUF1684 domain-containing protein n=1 Tax=Microbacterium sp. Leaf288 TaxID=1736323 RepID=UPI0006F4A5C2|nr:DUF1684 domain-containing protein [Microbacterium sp. Leaf288]KQP70071.1 hypothetical protein ASF40_09580 [Microbacterium sp. Leaf288]
MTLPASTPDTVTDARWRAVSSEHGIAALRHTHWLDTEPREYDGAPGVWRAVDGKVAGAGLRADAPGAPADDVVLAPGEHLDVGSVRLKAISREGSPALRVFDPETPGRTRLRGILSFPHDDAWALPGIFRPAAEGEINVIRSVDGYEREEPAVGTIALEVDGSPVELTVTGDPAHGLSAVIADATSNIDAYRFRFLEIDAPAADGTVTVDFNQAYLPPCAFSDHYVCPLPPANNRLAVRVEAGERITETA